MSTFEKTISVLGVIVALIGLCILAVQTSIMNTQTNLTMKSLEATIEQFRLDQRAWMGVEHMQVSSLTIGKPLQIDIKFRNSGKTPARNARISWGSHRRKPTREDIKTQTFEESAEFSLAPNAPHTAVLSAKSLIVRDSIAQLDAGKIVFGVFGTAIYHDVFTQTQRRTEFSGYYTPLTKPVLAFCEFGNSIE